MTPVFVPLPIWRNADYAETWVIADSFDHRGTAADPQDLTGWAFALQVRAYGSPDGTPLLSLVPVTTAVQGVRVIEPAAGQIEIRIDDASLETLPKNTNQGEPIRLVYDLVATDPTGLRRVYAFGDFIVQPGVTR